MAVAPPWLLAPLLCRSAMVMSPLADCVVMDAPAPRCIAIVGFRSTSAFDRPSATPPDTATPVAVPSASVVALACTVTKFAVTICAPSPMPARTSGSTSVVANAPLPAANSPPAAPTAVTTAVCVASDSTCRLLASVTSAPLVASVMPPERPVAVTAPAARPPTAKAVPCDVTRLFASALTSTAAPLASKLVALPVIALVSAAAVALALAPLSASPRPPVPASPWAVLSSPAWL
ncbi:MAG: hypothetical protein IPI44_07500 [Sulfuritalea sp.]|nr:hypothetical protein [Sulfuritalea sp.]